MCLFCFTISAPGSYDVEKSEKIIHQTSGAVTFGIKYKEQKPDDIPGKSFFNTHRITMLPILRFFKFQISYQNLRIVIFVLFNLSLSKTNITISKK